MEHRKDRFIKGNLIGYTVMEKRTLPLTQEFLAQMLGVQRSSVTLVARKLQEGGLIR